MQFFECIKDIPDPRKKRGVRHPFQAVLKLLLLGFTCRLVAVEHMVSFFSPIWGHMKGPLGFTRSRVPDPTTIRRIINGVKVEQVQKAFEQWVSDLVEGNDMVGSVDGKALRNVKGEDGTAKMLLNVFAQDIKLALAEYAIQEKEGEPTALKAALASLFDRYPGLKILVGDAAFAGKELNEAIITLGRDYVCQIKDNQPSLKKRLEEWFQGKMTLPYGRVTEVKKKARRKSINGTSGSIMTLERKS